MTKIISHRGAAGLALENTAESVRLALHSPVDGIEFDVRRTKDNQLVVIHDKHTSRIAAQKLYVHGSTLAELRAITLVNGKHLATPAEIMDIIDTKTRIVLDVKDSGANQAVLKLLQAHPRAKVTLSSRNYGELAELHEALPKLPFLVQSHLLSPIEIIQRAVGMGASGISLNKWLLNPLTYHLARRANLDICVYTVNHPLVMKFLTKLYPDITIYTDHPERFTKG